MHRTPQTCPLWHAIMAVSRVVVPYGVTVLSHGHMIGTIMNRSRVVVPYGVTVLSLGHMVEQIMNRSRVVVPYGVTVLPLGDMIGTKFPQKGQPLNAAEKCGKNWSFVCVFAFFASTCMENG